MFKKIKYLMGFEEVEDEEEYQEPKQIPKENKVYNESSNQPLYTSPVNKDNKVVSMTPKTNANYKLVLIEPKGFDECPKLVDNLKAKKPLIINLEKMDKDTARKIFDFLNGATYALDGTVQRVSTNIFVFAPENIDVSASQDSSGTFEGFKGSPWGV